MQYLISLSLTLVFELGLALAWGIRGRDLGLVALANILTNPLVVLVHNLAPGLLFGTILPEIWAILTEALIYIRKDNRIPRPALFAIAANVLSYTLGLLISFLA